MRSCSSTTTSVIEPGFVARHHRADSPIQRSAWVAGVTTIPGSGRDRRLRGRARPRPRRLQPRPRRLLAAGPGWRCQRGAAAYRRSAFPTAVGGFDDALFAYGEDVDLGSSPTRAAGCSWPRRRPPVARTSAARRWAWTRRGSGSSPASRAASCSVDGGSWPPARQRGRCWWSCSWWAGPGCHRTVAPLTAVAGRRAAGPGRRRIPAGRRRRAHRRARGAPAARHRALTAVRGLDSAPQQAVADLDRDRARRERQQRERDRRDQRLDQLGQRAQQREGDDRRGGRRRAQERLRRERAPRARRAAASRRRSRRR